MLTLVLYALLAIGLIAGLFMLAVRVLPAGEQIAPAIKDEPLWTLPEERAVSAPDVEQVRLPVALRGYRFAEVDQLLDRLAQELRERDEQIAALRDGSPRPIEEAAAVASVAAPGVVQPELEWAEEPQPEPEREREPAVLPEFEPAMVGAAPDVAEPMAYAEPSSPRRRWWQRRQGALAPDVATGWPSQLPQQRPPRVVEPAVSPSWWRVPTNRTPAVADAFPVASPAEEAAVVDEVQTPAEEMPVEIGVAEPAAVEAEVVAEAVEAEVVDEAVEAEAVEEEVAEPEVVDEAVEAEVVDEAEAVEDEIVEAQAVEEEAAELEVVDEAAEAQAAEEEVAEEEVAEPEVMAEAVQTATIEPEAEAVDLSDEAAALELDSDVAAQLSDAPTDQPDEAIDMQQQPAGQAESAAEPSPPALRRVWFRRRRSAEQGYEIPMIPPPDLLPEPEPVAAGIADPSTDEALGVPADEAAAEPGTNAETVPEVVAAADEPAPVPTEPQRRRRRSRRGEEVVAAEAVGDGEAWWQHLGALGDEPDIAAPVASLDQVVLPVDEDVEAEDAGPPQPAGPATPSVRGRRRRRVPDEAAEVTTPDVPVQPPVEEEPVPVSPEVAPTFSEDPGGFAQVAPRTETRRERKRRERAEQLSASEPMTVPVDEMTAETVPLPDVAAAPVDLVQSAEAEPAAAEPVQEAAVPAEQAAPERGGRRRRRTEPPAAEPAAAEPVEAEPVAAEPAAAEPVLEAIAPAEQAPPERGRRRRRRNEPPLDVSAFLAPAPDDVDQPPAAEPVADQAEQPPQEIAAEPPSDVVVGAVEHEAEPVAETAAEPAAPRRRRGRRAAGADTEPPSAVEPSMPESALPDAEAGSAVEEPPLPIVAEAAPPTTPAADVPATMPPPGPPPPAPHLQQASQHWWRRSGRDSAPVERPADPVLARRATPPAEPAAPKWWQAPAAPPTQTAEPPAAAHQPPVPPPPSSGWGGSPPVVPVPVPVPEVVAEPEQQAAPAPAPEPASEPAPAIVTAPAEDLADEAVDAADESADDELGDTEAPPPPPQAVADWQPPPGFTWGSSGPTGR